MAAVTPQVTQPPGSAYFLRLNRRRWDDMEIDSLGRPAATVVGAWLLLAWARFGPQLIGDLQAVVRFVLVGVYGWLALSLAIYLFDRLRGRRPNLETIVAKIGLAHQALAVGGFAIQIVQILPLPILATIVGVGSVLWMGGQLAAAITSLRQTSWIGSAPVAIAAWVGWLAVIGTYLWSRLGHLI